MHKHIALTGGIATGKSTVEGMLVALGIPVVDADALTHDLYANDSELRQHIWDTFGPHVFSGQDFNRPINRKVLGQAVFSQPEKLQLLESWIHPKVKAAQRQFAQANADKPLIVTSIPILFEKGREKDFDEVWLVYAPEAVQRQRLINHRHMTTNEASARLASQWPIDDKRALADVVIDNSGSLDATRQQVVALVTSLLKAKETRPT